VRYAFIKEHREELPVRQMCRVLQVSRSGYYDWLTRPAGARQRRQEELTERIRQAHADSRQLYGAPRIHAELNEQGVNVCENTVARLMSRAGIRSKAQKRFVARTTDSDHAHAVAGNLLGRDFDRAKGPDRLWCADLTCIWTDQGWLYLAAVMDLCSRRIVGWAMADHVRAELCTGALAMALERRSPDRGLVHHSDRGVQYACADYQALLEAHGIACSMSRRGDCYDNAAMESFFSSFKRELVYQRQTPYADHGQAKAEVFEYIECWYNRRRRHSSLGYVSPVEFEASLN
jgi:transposase InsO family protein